MLTFFGKRSEHGGRNVNLHYKIHEPEPVVAKFCFDTVDNELSEGQTWKRF